MQNVYFIKKVYLCAQSTVTDTSPQAGTGYEFHTDHQTITIYILCL